MSQTPEAFMEVYEKATNGHNLQATLALVDEEAVYFFSDESVHRGKEAIGRVLRRNFDLIQDETYTLTNLHWLVRSDEVAACIYDYAWTGTIQGRPASGAGRGTTILQRSNAGWKVIHEHLSRGSLGENGASASAKSGPA